MIQVILVQVFCSLRTEIYRRSLTDFVLIFANFLALVVFAVFRGNLLPNSLHVFLFFSSGTLKLENSFRR